MSVVFELIGLVEVLDTDFAVFDSAGRDVDVFTWFLAFSPNYLIVKRNRKRRIRRLLHRGRWSEKMTKQNNERV